MVTISSADFFDIFFPLLGGFFIGFSFPDLKRPSAERQSVLAFFTP